MRLNCLTSVFTLLGVSPVYGHCYSIWHYPKPQHCRAQAYAKPTERPHPPPARKEEVEFSLPELDKEWKWQDTTDNEQLRAKGLLREKYDDRSQ